MRATYLKMGERIGWRKEEGEPWHKGRRAVGRNAKRMSAKKGGERKECEREDADGGRKEELRMIEEGSS
jgi:hypothetical protein